MPIFKERIYKIANYTGLVKYHVCLGFNYNQIKQNSSTLIGKEQQSKVYTCNYKIVSELTGHYM